MTAMLRCKIDNPHFTYFLRGHPGMRLREDVERCYGVKIQVLSNTDELVIDGSSEQREQKAMDDLRQGWHDDDFAKARELTDLYLESHDYRFMNVAPKFVSSLIGHYGKRVAGLESRSGADIKIDVTGHVAIFGATTSCERAADGVAEWIRRENGELGLVPGSDPAEDHLSPPASISSRSFIDRADSDFPLPFEAPVSTSSAPRQEECGPSLVTFWVSTAASDKILGPGGNQAADMERDWRCLINVQEAGTDGLVPIEITARDNRKALEAKDGILAWVLQFVAKDWPDRVRIRTIGSPQDPQARSKSRSKSTSSSQQSSPQGLLPLPAAASSSHSINGGPPPIKGDFRAMMKKGPPPPLPTLMGQCPPFTDFPPPDTMGRAGPIPWFPMPLPPIEGMGALVPPPLPPCSRLKFSVSEDTVAHLIGPGGSNKRSLEQRFKCILMLHPEAIKDGNLPVEVLAHSAEDCEAARDAVYAFLGVKGSPTSSESSPSSQKPELVPKPTLPLITSPPILHNMVAPPQAALNPAAAAYRLLRADSDDGPTLRPGPGFSLPGPHVGSGRPITGQTALKPKPTTRTTSNDFFSDLDEALSDCIEDSPEKAEPGNGRHWIDWLQGGRMGNGVGSSSNGLAATDFFNVPHPNAYFTDIRHLREDDP